MKYANSILKIINASEEHLTAEQIFLILKQIHPSVVLATVYNNLNNLYQQGQIRKISLEGCPDRYDKNTRHATAHRHLVHHVRPSLCYCRIALSRARVRSSPAKTR